VYDQIVLIPFNGLRVSVKAIGQFASPGNQTVSSVVEEHDENTHPLRAH